MSDHGNFLLIVGVNARNQELLAEFVVRLGYRVIRADTLAEVDAVLAQQETPDFALVDITGFDQGVWDRCTRLNAQNTPVLIISPRQSAEVTSLSRTHGARSVLAKPLIMKELANVIHSFMSPGDKT